MDLSVLIINILLGFNIIFLLSVIFVERKRPQSTIAWILVLTLLPVVGGILYLFFGSTLNLRFSGKLKKSTKILIRQPLIFTRIWINPSKNLKT